jgi:hypothetical protein
MPVSLSAISPKSNTISLSQILDYSGYFDDDTQYAASIIVVTGSSVVELHTHDEYVRT